MAKSKNIPIHKYLVVKSEAFLTHPHLQVLAFEHDPVLWNKFSSLQYNAYAISEKHPNISIISVMATSHMLSWMDLHGEHELVKPLI